MDNGYLHIFTTFTDTKTWFFSWQEIENAIGSCTSAMFASVTFFRRYVRFFCNKNENPGIPITQHTFVEPQLDIFPLFSGIRSVLKGQGEQINKKRQKKATRSFVMEPFKKHGPAGKERDKREAWLNSCWSVWMRSFLCHGDAFSFSCGRNCDFNPKKIWTRRFEWRASFCGKNATAGGSTALSDGSQS